MDGSTHAAHQAAHLIGSTPTAILDLPTIERLLAEVDPVSAVRDGFIAYSLGQANIPPVGELLLHGGECHIKYGTTTSSPYYVVKIASGFDDNARLGLPGGNGLVCLFDVHTGWPLAVLLDQGLLTDLRTAAAGALSAQLLAPPDLQCLGFIGTGAQARHQARALRLVTDCRRALCWGRQPEKAQALAYDLAALGYDARPAPTIAELIAQCHLVVTTTRADTPLVLPEHLHPGLHLTAVGSDTPHKQELHPDVLAAAHIVAVDAKPQAQLRGEAFHAARAGTFQLEHAVELGQLAQHPQLGRTSARQITVADLTGVAVQDLYLAAAVYDAWRNQSHPPIHA